MCLPCRLTTTTAFTVNTVTVTPPPALLSLALPQMWSLSPPFVCPKDGVLKDAWPHRWAREGCRYTEHSVDWDITRCYYELRSRVINLVSLIQIKWTRLTFLFSRCNLQLKRILIPRPLTPPPSLPSPLTLILPLLTLIVVITALWSLPQLLTWLKLQAAHYLHRHWCNSQPHCLSWMWLWSTSIITNMIDTYRWPSLPSMQLALFPSPNVVIAFPYLPPLS